MERSWTGEVLRTTQVEVREGGLPTSRMPGEWVVGCLRQAGREATFADLATQEAGRLQEAELRSGLEAVSTVASALQRARVRLACEARQRGLHSTEGMSLADWLALRCPDLAKPVLHDLVRMAQAGQEQVHAPLVDGVLTGGMSLERAAKLHRVLARIRRAVSPEEYGQAVDLMASAGCNPDLDDRKIDLIIAKLLQECLPEKKHEERRRAQHELRDVHESSLADGTVRRIIMTFGDDADYQAVKAILTSPLAAPASREEVEATGEEDRRTPGQRRYDALMTVLRRGVAGSKGQPTTAKATLIVTLDLETLRRQLSEGGGQLPGCGATIAGATVSAESIRRLACEADLIPMVLGGPSEVVDQGRRHRLVTPGQRVRLAVRDKGCTIPGCTVPATWCDAHHVIPWARGGRSDLSNYALLCPRHHTWVHERELTATVDEHGVTWHVR
ncbi:HNH endonuclease signature motif containing protein [Ornithinimicrobium sufpigmenti]|uniref:HNH endonuclease signature motif containing protein n=1 Tax=Ornithinimicrobium sufpigmenti TaxID=2508882 RepID=UPI0015E192C0|nr:MULTISPECIES: HNH endonuclease signature motif containing protein [unclassified Ornithinimicrobium]